MPTLETILEQALTLSVVEREALIDDLICSVGPHRRDKPSQALIDEAERRLDAYERGELKTFTPEESKRRLGLS